MKNSAEASGLQRGGSQSGALTTGRGTIRRPSSRFSDIWSAPLHDFPIRDEILFQFLPLSPQMDVLEIGPGSGFTAFRLARQVRRMTLVDVSSNALEDVRAHLGQIPNLDFVCADLSLPGLVARVGQEFDVAFGLDVFEYVVDPGACLKNLAAVLRPGGQLFLSYPNVPPPVGDGVTYFSCQQDLDQLLDKAGFARWEIFAVRLRPFATEVYRALHEWPLRLYRRLRGSNRGSRPQIYERTWAFQQRQKFSRLKVPVHAFWAFLGQAMRLGGDVFVGDPELNGNMRHQLVIRAWK